MTDESGKTHTPCMNLEIGDDGRLTGAVCRKSKGHDDRRRNPDPRRRAHFDPDQDVIWGYDQERVSS